MFRVVNTSNGYVEFEGTEDECNSHMGLMINEEIDFDYDILDYTVADDEFYENM